MTLTGFLVGGAVIIVLLFLVLSKLREKNPQRYNSIVGYIKKGTSKMPKLPQKMEQKDLNIKYEEARIM